MASRNERKKRAKARNAELRQAVTDALALEAAKKRADKQARADYAARVQDALRFHRNPSNKAGKVIGGKFVPIQTKEPAKRKLTLNAQTGKMIERRKRAI